MIYDNTNEYGSHLESTVSCDAHDAWNNRNSDAYVATSLHKNTDEIETEKNDSVSFYYRDI